MMSSKLEKKEDYCQGKREASCSGMQTEEKPTVLMKSHPIPIPLLKLETDPFYSYDCCKFPKPYPQCCRCKTCCYSVVS